MIKVAVISRNQLKKRVWEFAVEEDYRHGCILRYKSFMVYRRDSVYDIWPDRLPPPLSFEDWCVANGVDEENEENEEAYQRYLDRVNPVMQKTKKGGYPKASGCSGSFKFMPPCPRFVAERAREQLKKSIRLVYERGNEN